MKSFPKAFHRGGGGCWLIALRGGEPQGCLICIRAGRMELYCNWRARGVVCESNENLGQSVPKAISLSDAARENCFIGGRFVRAGGNVV